MSFSFWCNQKLAICTTSYLVLFNCSSWSKNAFIKTCSCTRYWVKTETKRIHLWLRTCSWLNKLQSCLVYHYLSKSFQAQIQREILSCKLGHHSAILQMGLDYLNLKTWVECMEQFVTETDFFFLLAILLYLRELFFFFCLLLCAERTKFWSMRCNSFVYIYSLYRLVMWTISFCTQQKGEKNVFLIND